MVVIGIVDLHPETRGSIDELVVDSCQHQSMDIRLTHGFFGNLVEETFTILIAFDLHRGLKFMGGRFSVEVVGLLRMDLDNHILKVLSDKSVLQTQHRNPSKMF